MPHLNSQTKIVPLQTLAQRSAEFRARGLRVVLTNGCFDLLHAGHVQYLEAARSLGDVLMVAINSDASVRRLKQAGRPFNRDQDRMHVVAGLEAVNFVTLFDDPTAELVAEAVCPAIYVKGGDYSEDPASDRYPVEGHVVSAHGGAVHIVDYVPGRSTTDVVARIRADV